MAFVLGFVAPLDPINGEFPIRNFFPSENVLIRSLNEFRSVRLAAMAEMTNGNEQLDQSCCTVNEGQQGVLAKKGKEGQRAKDQSDRRLPEKGTVETATVEYGTVKPNCLKSGKWDSGQ